MDERKNGGSGQGQEKEISPEAKEWTQKIMALQVMVAHHLNQPLTTILSELHLAKGEHQALLTILGSIEGVIQWINMGIV